MFYTMAVIQFLVAEKESVMSIHRWLNNVYCLGAVNKSTVSCWASQISGSEKDQAELNDICHSGKPTTAVTWALLQCAGELI
jgi:hypothetical protein